MRSTFLWNKNEPFTLASIITIMFILVLGSLVPGGRSFTISTTRQCPLTTNRRNGLLRMTPEASAGGVSVDENVPDTDDNDEPEASSPPFAVAVIGGGWAGFSAADALSLADKNIQVHLLDASPRGPGGLAGAGWKTPKLGQPVEAGIHGFWREYRNTFAQMERIGLDVEQVLTPYVPSLLVSSEGRVAVAPVLGESSVERQQDGDGGEEPSSRTESSSSSNSSIDPLLQRIADALPPPLDIALLAEYDKDSKLTLADRLSALGLLGVWADFGQEDAASWERYDAISADQLFRTIARISPRLSQQLVDPLLHVLPMTTAYDCSAAAALSCFHVFALQSRGAFDVRWCRGSIADQIFNPWVEQLNERGNVHIAGSSRVTSMERLDNQKLQLVINDQDTLKCDAVVLAVGATAAKRLIDSCPPLQQVPKLAEKWQDLRGVTCVAVRLFLDRSVVPSAFLAALETVPAVTVCGPAVLPSLVETGFCLYDLSRLQDDFADSSSADDAPMLAMEVDFFRADTLAALSDDETVALTWKTMQKVLLGSVETTTIPNDMVLDYFVVRARNAVSHFCVGSAATSPDIRLDGKGLYMCGDWIDRKGGHASWSTEKAVVTGRQAAAAVAEDFGLVDNNAVSDHFEIIPAASETPQLQALRKAAALWRSSQSALSRFTANQSPWQSGDPNRIFPRAPWSK